MPNALLQDNGLAIGSSYHGFEAQRQITKPGASVMGHIQDSSPMRRQADPSSLRPTYSVLQSDIIDEPENCI